MIWEKQGLVYVAEGLKPWAVSHAYLPTTWMKNESEIRVYVAFVDKDKVGRIGFVDVDAQKPTRVLRVSEKPVLDIGESGTFDDNGVTPVSLVERDGKLYFYYIGWQVCVKIRYTLFMGLAVSTDGGESFVRVSKTPILDRSDSECFIRSAGFTQFHQERWKMWYIAGSHWIESHGVTVPTYNMRYLESDNGVDWGKSGKVCLNLVAPDEYGFGRPFILIEEGRYCLWYSIRTHSKGYRIGYAESNDGINWQRKDHEAGIDVSPSGWDSQMVHCSCIQKTKYGTYMFYNGNNYGETGFGVAALAP